MLSAPTSTAPAASIRSISVASRGDGAQVAIDFRSGAGRQALHIEQVLHRERHPGERAGTLPGRDRGIDGARFGARAIRGDVGE